MWGWVWIVEIFGMCFWQQSDGSQECGMLYNMLESSTENAIGHDLQDV